MHCAPPWAVKLGVAFEAQRGWIKRQWTPRRKTGRIRDGEDFTLDLTQLSCEDFLSRLASKTPAPGGGGAAALVGAAGLALGNMVGNLTTGKRCCSGVNEIDL